MRPRGRSARLNVLTRAPATPLAPLEELLERANSYAVDARSTRTRKAYLCDFSSFEAWCARRALVAMPATPAVVAVYLSELAHAGKKPSTIERALTGIAHAHRARGYDWRRADKAVARVMSGIRRRHDVAPAQKAPVLDVDLAVMVSVQRTAARAGLDPKTVSGHSLRVGFATTAAKKGKSLESIMRQTLHKSEKVARAYIRHAKMFDDNAAVGIA